MLIDFSVQNFKSFNSKQELSMIASTSTKENFNLQNIIPIQKFGIDKLVKSTAIFGANASGKSNFSYSFTVLKTILLGSLDSTSSKSLDLAQPFLLQENYFEEPIEFEVSFLSSGYLFRYGISIVENEISEEWLYWTENSRETMLFQRDKETIKYNQRSFSEAKDFVDRSKDIWIVEKTKKYIPFISVLSQFDGEISNMVIDWFQKLNVISGVRDDGFKKFTLNLFEKDVEFKAWALEILQSLQISDIRIVEEERSLPFQKSKGALDEELNDAISKLTGFLEKNKIFEKKIEVVKKNQNTNKKYVLPLSLESEGTRKLIYLLGPLYDIINNNGLLIIDEFDNKFHSLLSNFIIKLFHKQEKSLSQLILTCHDTNLLNRDLFRRDQIWFIEKNQKHESELYSLLEYKEHYTRKDDSYSKDYLAGKYGAIPLFSDVQELEDFLNG